MPGPGAPSGFPSTKAATSVSVVLGRQARSWAGLVVLALVAVLAPLAVQQPGAAHAQTIVTYSIGSRGAITSDMAEFSRVADQTLNDPRGWSVGNRIQYRQVSSGGSFTLWLATPDQMTSFNRGCSPQWSCRSGRNVIINEMRWRHGTPYRPGSVADYRQYVINHEIGHWQGISQHWLCPGPGHIAPVMMTQSSGTQGCVVNTWPLPGELAVAARKHGIRYDATLPIGSFDAAVRVQGGVRVTGWALDADYAGPVDIVFFIGGRLAGGARATLYRPDVGAAHPSSGPNRGFDHVIPHPPDAGATVCAEAIDPNGVTRVPLGCRQMANGVPIGVIDEVRNGIDTTVVAGWAIDPDTAGPVTVRVTTPAGVELARSPASMVRPDLGPALPGYGTAHGYRFVLPRHANDALCVEAFDTTTGAPTRLGCRTAPDAPPIGHLDIAGWSPSGLRLAGWALDPDAPTASLAVHVYVDGRFVAGTPTARPRPDVAAALSGAGGRTGFDLTITPTAVGPVGPGSTMCVFALGADGGVNRRLGCRSAAAAAPVGSLDGAARAQVVTVAGWAAEPSRPHHPATVEILVNGAVVHSGAADRPRPDVAAARPAFGPDRGFRVDLTEVPAGAQVCVRARESRSGVVTVLGCATV